MSNDGNIGQSATLASFKITGVVNPVDEDLTDGGLDTPGLRLESQGYGNAVTNPINQVFVTSDDSYWVTYTLPAANFSLVSKATLTDTHWIDFAPTPSFANGPQTRVLAPTASLPSPDSGYFAMLQRTNFTQLQVLLPGESPAPNTPSGKTGTPDPVFLSLGGTVDVTVRAVDPDWNLITGPNDTIHLTTDDGLAFVPGDAAMVNGVVTFTGVNSVTFGATGSFTITATNMSRVMPAATSSAVTVDF
jgi:hypothetical protein